MITSEGTLRRHARTWVARGRLGTKAAAVGLVLTAGLWAVGAQAATPGQTVWQFDNLKSIGGHKTEVEGHPKVISLPGNHKAIEFNGVDDAIWVENHPVAGAKTFTIEAIFRPDGGPQAQRWFHIASIDPKTGQAALPTGTADPNPRFTFELRLQDHTRWFLDAFTHGCAHIDEMCGAKDGYNMALMNPDKTHPIGLGYAVAQTYDGTTYRSYVNGVLQMEAKIAFKPQGPGRTSIGTRMNRLNYFRGAVMETRFTPTALSPDQMLKVPADLNAPEGRRAPPKSGAPANGGR